VLYFFACGANFRIFLGLLLLSHIWIYAASNSALSMAFKFPQVTVVDLENSQSSVSGLTLDISPNPFNPSTRISFNAPAVNSSLEIDSLACVAQNDENSSEIPSACSSRLTTFIQDNSDLSGLGKIRKSSNSLGMLAHRKAKAIINK